MPRHISTAKKHQLRHVVDAVTSTPWAILPQKLGEIMDLVSLRRQGLVLSEDEIRERIGGATPLAERLQISVPVQLSGRGQGDAPAYLMTESGIALIPLDGVIAPRMNLMMRYSGGTSTQAFAAAVRQAAADPDVKAIVIPIDSPGGSALGLEEPADALRMAREKKPTIAVNTALMASAAYYVGSAAGEVVAGASTLTGSLGTVSVHEDTSQADAQAGLKYTVITAGEFKWADHGYAPLTEKGRAVMQEGVDAFNAAFVASVAKSRGITPEEVNERYGRGKTFIGSKALEAGLVDRVASLHEVIQELEAKIAAGSLSGTSRSGSSTAGRQSSAAASGQQSTFSHSQKESTVDPKVFAALVAMKLIAANASEDVAKVALGAWYKAKGKAQPESPDEVLQDLEGKTETPANTQATTPPANQTTTTPPANPPAASDPAEAERIKLAERNRVENIRASGEVLGVDVTKIQAAIDNGQSLDVFLTEARKSKGEEETPVGRIQGGPAAADKFKAAAVDALFARSPQAGEKKTELSEAAKSLQYASLMDIARESLRMSCGRAPVGDPDTIARAALGDFQAMHDLGIYAADVPFHSPGDFPNLLSGLANKQLDAAPRYRGTTFQFWARQRSSLADFKPATMHRVGEFGEFPIVPDAQDFTQSKLAEEYSWIAVDSYGDEFAFTPRMMVDDDLGALMDALNDKVAAHDMTLNRLCVNLLVGNPLWTDQVNVFAAGHGNLVALGAGAAPSQTTLAAARLALRALTGPGGKRQLNYTVAGLLIPEALETTTQQFLSPNVVVTPVTTATGEIFRGQVKWWVEPMLTDASATGWYAFADPAIARQIVYAYQRGFESMRKRDYYNPKNNCRIFQFEGRFAAAVNTWRGLYFNAGA